MRILYEIWVDFHFESFPEFFRLCLGVTCVMDGTTGEILLLIAALIFSAGYYSDSIFLQFK